MTGNMQLMEKNVECLGFMQNEILV